LSLPGGQRPGGGTWSALSRSATNVGITGSTMSWIFAIVVLWTGRCLAAVVVLLRLMERAETRDKRPDVRQLMSGGRDLANLFERAAADGTPIREIVGEDPVAFVEALVQNYEPGGYVTRERNRLISAIDHAAGEDAGKEKGTV
jgi:hypothetical protein